MAESVQTTGTSLQYRLLVKRIEKLEGAVPAARALQVARLQGLADGAARIYARANDHGVFEVWPHL